MEQVHGLDAVRDRIGAMVVEARLPQAGAAKSPTYTGDGYITVRHRETAAVEEALDLIDATVTIDYTGTGDSRAGEWRHRLQYAEKQLYKPPWEHDHVMPLRNQPGGEPL